MKNKSKSGGGSITVGKTLLTIIIMVFIVVAGVSINDQPTLLQQMIERVRKARGMSLDELNATPEMKQLRDKGLPEEAIYAYILHSPYYDRDAILYPVTDQSIVIVKIAKEDSYSWKLDDAKYSMRAGEQLPAVVEQIEPVEEGDYSYARLVFRTLLPEAYHQTFTIASITVYGSYASLARQLNWQPFSSDRDDISFFVVSPEEMATLNEVRKMCKARYCIIP